MEAEEEKIVEHAKEAIHALTDKKKNWKAKIGSFLWEILIIIIAVNLTIGFHNWNEKRHERELEKEFLIGTRDDLDIIKNDLDRRLMYYHQPTLDYYNMVWKQINERRIDKTYVDSNSNRLLLADYFRYDNSRFESFKSSGYLRLIKNPALLLDITHLYADNFPTQVDWDHLLFNERRQGYIAYIAPKARIDSSGITYISDLLDIPEVKFQIKWQRYLIRENQSSKRELMRLVERIMGEIDKELKDRFGYEFKKEEGKKQEKS